MLLRARTDYCKMIHKNSEMYRGHSHDRVQPWENTKN